jgi:N-acetyl-anhydromuramyl-L-alanine amidase AmpD
VQIVFEFAPFIARDQRIEQIVPLDQQAHPARAK